MLRTFLKTSLRSFARHKGYTLINLFGLVVGITSSLLITLYVHHVFTYDHFHKQKDNIYLVYKERITPTGTQETFDTWVPLLQQLKMDYPQVSKGTRIAPSQARITLGDKTFEEDVEFIDPEYFEVFSFEINEGNPAKPFDGLNSLVLSEEAAIRLFGRIDVVGQLVDYRDLNGDFQKPYTVSAVLEHYPANTTVTPSILLPIRSLPNYGDLEDSWGSSFLSTYVQIPRRRAAVDLEQSFPALIEKLWDRRTSDNTNFKLLPLTQSYDAFVGDSSYATLLVGIAIAIVLIASFNFVNLATARSIERAREIGIRKIMGAMAGNLRWQFLTEAHLLVILSAVASLLLAWLILPYLSTSIGAQLSADLYGTYSFWLLLLAFTVMLGFATGSYPAFYLSGIKANVVTRAFTGGRAGTMVRNGLVVFQFALGVAMIVSTLVISRQIRYMTTTEMGFDAQRVVINMSVDDFSDADEGRSKIASFKNTMENTAGIDDITLSRHVPSQWSGSFTFVRPQGWEGDPLRMRFTYHDAKFFEAFGIEKVQGEGFLPDSEGDQRESVMLNEAAMNAFGWEDIYGKNIVLGNSQVKVVGVVKNFNYETLRKEIAPILHFHRAPTNAVHRFASFNSTPQQLKKVLPTLTKEWEKLGAQRPLEYFFLNESVGRMYEEEARLLKLVSYFTAVALIVAALGLYGLTSFVVDRRRKEISIRKVVGASVINIFSLIARHFGRLILLAFALGSMASYFLISQWLESFAYRISPDISLYLITMLLVVGLMLITISYKTIKAGLVNPIRYLREE